MSAIGITTDDLLISQSGRRLAPVPVLKWGSVRATQKSLRLVDAWVVGEAIKEAAATRNDYMATLLAGINLGRMSPSDRDTANLYLFGDHEGPSADQFIPQ